MIRYDGHIGPVEGAILLFAILGSQLFLHAPARLIDFGGPAAWQSALIMTASLLLLLLPMAALVRRFPEQGLAGMAQAAAGPFLGSLLAIFVAVWFLLVTGESARNFTETFQMTILPETPPSAMVLVLVGTVAYIAYKGLEPLARTTQVLFILIAVGLLFTLVFSLPNAVSAYLFPYWGYGLVNTTMGGLWNITMGTETVALLALAYAFRKPGDFRKSGLWGILLFGVATTFAVVMLVATFGAPHAAQLPYPLYSLARLVDFGRFVQRLESLLVLFWIFAATVRLGALFLVTVTLFSGALKLPDYRPVIFPMSVLVFALALLPDHFVTVLRLDSAYLRPLGFAVLGLPLLLLLLSYIRKGAHVT